MRRIDLTGKKFGRLVVLGLAGEVNYQLYNGIDRIDNARGYERDNIVPCCKFCNRAKSAMPQKEFIDLVRRIAARHP
jgi:hypothetical protein